MARVCQNGGFAALPGHTIRSSSCPFCRKPICPFEAHSSLHLSHCQAGKSVHCIALCLDCGQIHSGKVSEAEDHAGAWGGEAVVFTSAGTRKKLPKDPTGARAKCGVCNERFEMKQQLIRFPCDCVYHHKCVGKAGGLILRKT